MRGAVVLVALLLVPSLASAWAGFDGSMIGPSGELFAFTAADDGKITLVLDPGAEPALVSLTFFDAAGRADGGVRGYAEDNDLEVVVNKIRFTSFARSPISGTLHIGVGDLCAGTCTLLLHGAGDVARIDYSFQGTDGDVTRIGGGFRTYLADSDKPQNGTSIAARGNGEHIAVQRDVHDRLSFAGSPVIFGDLWPSLSRGSVMIGNMTVVPPGGEPIPCSCTLGDISQPAPGDYTIHWDRVHAGRYPFPVYHAVDVVLPS